MTSERDDLPAAVAADINGTFKKTISCDEANNTFIDFLSNVTKDCAAAGAVMIGHVKANVRSGNEMLAINSTTEDGHVRIRSQFSSDVSEYTMTINVIVYGVVEKRISEILDKRRSTLGMNKMKIYSDTGCTDPKCSDPECVDNAHRIIKLE